MRGVGIRVHDLSSPRIRGHDDEGDARPVAEEIDRLKKARIPVASPFIEGDEDGGPSEEVRMRLELVENPLHERFEQIELRAPPGDRRRSCPV